MERRSSGGPPQQLRLLFLLLSLASAADATACERKPVSQLSVNVEGAALMKEYEGNGKPGRPYYCYRDMHARGYPNGLWTVGYGHACPTGRVDFACNGCRSQGTSFRVTPAQANALVVGDIEKIVKPCMRRMVKVPLTSNEYSALGSWMYNLGCRTSSSLFTVLNAGDYARIPAKLNEWTKGGGKVLKGLVRRRAAEGRLWSKGQCSGPASSGGLPPASDTAAAGATTTTTAAGATTTRLPPGGSPSYSTPSRVYDPALGATPEPLPSATPRRAQPYLPSPEVGVRQYAPAADLAPWFGQVTADTGAQVQANFELGVDGLPRHGGFVQHLP